MIYLDYNATTPVAAEVLSAMLPFFTEQFYNPSSSYPEAQAVAAAVAESRKLVADLLGTTSDQVVWTSGGTESNNWAIQGSLTYWHGKRRRILVSAIEHPSVAETVRLLASDGVDVKFIPVDSHGIVRMDVLDTLLDERTALVSVMLANNEIGTIQPVADIAQRAHRVGALVHTDASQAVGKIPVNMSLLDVDLLTVAGHKLYAPKGIGALVFKAGLDFPAGFRGGAQERGRRSGTENVAGIVGLGRAAALAHEWFREKGPTTQRALRNELEHHLQQEIPQCHIFGQQVPRLPNTVGLAIEGWVGADLLSLCPDLRAGTGSACHSLTDEGSPTLRAMGILPALARGLIRLSLGRQTSSAEVLTAAQILARAVQTKPKSL